MDKKYAEKGIAGVISIILMALVVVVAGYSYINKVNPLQLLPNLIKETSAPVTISSSQAQVTITDKSFEPATLQIEKGQQVTWVNQDQDLHQVASDPHPTHTNLSGFDSEEPLAKDDAFSFIFEKEGTFTYHDHLNPLEFKGTIIVK
ncbi:MAG: cupredoxin domain-containing protein [Candidatus Daviesbacteria bacterium]|nr:cupredoxin domain-containing protein [Candidatus Daviesbacteria bacterium]